MSKTQKTVTLKHVTQKIQDKIFPLNLHYIKMEGKRDMIHS